jgi:hypothetical protein
MELHAAACLLLAYCLLACLLDYLIVPGRRSSFVIVSAVVTAAP